MSCTFFNGCGCGCGCCRNFVKSTKIELSGSDIIITIPNLSELKNMQRLCIALAQPIPAGVNSNGFVQVVTEDGKIKLFVLTNCGNALYGDQLRCRSMLYTRAATDISVLIASTKTLCATRHDFPIIPNTPVKLSSPVVEAMKKGAEK